MIYFIILQKILLLDSTFKECKTNRSDLETKKKFLPTEMPKLPKADVFDKNKLLDFWNPKKLKEQIKPPQNQQNHGSYYRLPFM